MLYSLPVPDDLPGESKGDIHKFKLAIPFTEKEKYDWKEDCKTEGGGRGARHIIENVERRSRPELG